MVIFGIQLYTYVLMHLCSIVLDAVVIGSRALSKTVVLSAQHA